MDIPCTAGHEFNSASNESSIDFTLRAFELALEWSLDWSMMPDELSFYVEKKAFTIKDRIVREVVVFIVRIWLLLSASCCF